MIYAVVILATLLAAALFYIFDQKVVISAEKKLTAAWGNIAIDAKAAHDKLKREFEALKAKL